jgi:hypothetical protein
MSILLKLIYGLKATSHQNPSKIILKFSGKPRNWNTQSSFEKEKRGIISLPDFKNCYADLGLGLCGVGRKQTELKGTGEKTQSTLTQPYSTDL